jgi:hypothetical protein
MNDLPAQPDLAPRPSRRRDPRTAVVIVGGAIAVLVGVILVSLLLGRPGPGGDGVAVASPSGSASPDPSASPSPILPSGSPAPTGSPASPASPAPAATPPPTGSAGGRTPFPIQAAAQDVLMAPGPDGGVYVLVPVERRAVIALVSSDGHVAAGWPIELDSGYCWQLLSARDGSVRAVCDVPPGADDGLQAPVARIHAIDARGRPRPGWPVEIESGSVAAMNGDGMAVVVRPYGGDALPEGVVEPAMLVLVGPDGSIRTSNTEVPVPCCQSTVVLGPDGTGYIVARRYTGDRTGTTNVTVFRLDGVAWRMRIDGIASDPAFDARGNAYYSAWTGGTGTSSTFVVDPNGRMLEPDTDEVAIVPTSGWTGAGDEFPATPGVAVDRSMILVDDRDGTTLLALDADGEVRSGWPYHVDAGTEDAGYCPAEDTGCGLFRVPTVTGPDGVVYVALEPTSPTAGGSLIAVGRDGRIRDGWPVGLRNAGSRFWAIVPGTDGGIWALAAEPESRGYSGTILSIAPDSTVRGRLTIAEP